MPIRNHPQRPYWALVLILGPAFLATSAGCSNSGKRQTWTAQKPPLLANDRSTATMPYRVAQGDVLKISPQSGDEPLQIVIPVDGKIHLPGHAPHPVDGLTAAEIEQTLRPLLDCRVEVLEHQSQVILVAGIFEEKAPRPIPYQGPETVEDLMRRVSCPDCQHGYRVRVVRPSVEVGGEPQIFAEDYDDQSHREGATAGPIRLQPGDYVYVEKDFGRKGPLTLMTDRRFFDSSFRWVRKLRLAQANVEFDTTK